MTAEPHPATTVSCPARRRRALVLYDGDCALCRKSLELLRRLDWLGALEYVNVRDPEQLRRCPVSVSPERLLEEMHLLPPGGGEVYHGFRAFRWMAWRLPPLWSLVPLLYLPGMATLGQRAYLWVARHRFQLVPCHGGVCTLSAGKAPGQRQTPHSSPPGAVAPG